MESINLTDNSLSICGAKKVVSCTQTQAVIDTTDKRLVVSGSEIEVKKLNLDNGEVCLSGIFSNLKISGAEEKKPLLKRIFK